MRAFHLNLHPGYQAAAVVVMLAWSFHQSKMMLRLVLLRIRIFPQRHQTNSALMILAAFFKVKSLFIVVVKDRL